MNKTMDAADARHREEERKRREKRKAARESKSDSRLEKEAKRKEHIQRTLHLKNKEHQQRSSGSGSAKKPSSSKPTSSSSNKGSSGPSDGGSSKFQALFSNRAEGFMIELNFRNAPPRPPVGPCFVGVGFDGMLNRWTKYRAFNAVETGYSWKLHAENDLGVPLAPAAMDLKCYRDPTDNGSSRNSNKRRKLPAGYTDDDDALDDENENSNSNGRHKSEPPPLHPDDEALINWKGSLGDSAAEHLQIRRDRARAEARAQSQGKIIPTPKTNRNKMTTFKGLDRTPSNNSGNTSKNTNRNRFESRVLNEAPQPWMMRTTYIDNNATGKLHDPSRASSIKKGLASKIDKQMSETKKKIYDPETIEAGFQLMNKKSTMASNHKNKHAAKHPSKRHLTPVYEFPLLPDINTWGHTYTHVVLDKPPKIDSSRNKGNNNATNNMVERISKAFITDVEKHEQNSKMICKLLAPEQMKKSADKDLDDNITTNYEVTQAYDLDVTPLKDENSPHINFLFIIDEENQVVRYHPVSSRVNLSTGRPSRPDKSIIAKRTLSENDVQEIEMRVAEIDEDAQKKYNLDDDFGEDHDDDNDDEDDDDDSIGGFD